LCKALFFHPQPNTTPKHNINNKKEYNNLYKHNPNPYSMSYTISAFIVLQQTYKELTRGANGIT